LKTDFYVRNLLKKELEKVHLSSIEFFRDGDKKYIITIKTSKTGMIVGKGGDGIEKLTKKIKHILKKNNLTVPKDLKIAVEDVRSPDADAGIVAAIVKEGLEKKMPFRRVMKSAIEKSMANRDVKGIKISLSGALGGAAMARKEFIKKGRIPLSTFRADVDYRTIRANLPLGVIGVKV
jgi:small subunit ribosomal protein S3